MQRTWFSFTPIVVMILLVSVMWMHGPIAQPAHYHEFADARVVWNIANAMDVLSNVGFLLVGVWALFALLPSLFRRSVNAVTVAYFLFAVSIFATAFASAYYHLAPDNARLFWDRLPIALACASLLAAVRLDTVQSRWRAGCELALWMTAAWWSVWWWQSTADLRPYLALQVMAIVLIPLWQYLNNAPASQRSAFAWAIVLYVLAKVCELADATILSHLVWVSGHSLKHVLSAMAAGVILWDAYSINRIEKRTAGV